MSYADALADGVMTNADNVVANHNQAGRTTMKKLATAVLAGAALSFCFVALAEAKGKVIGVSWSNFQEERWKTDEAAMKVAIAAAGDKYISADAQSSAQK